jgi:hypothetical protein
MLKSGGWYKRNRCFIAMGIPPRECNTSFYIVDIVICVNSTFAMIMLSYNFYSCMCVCASYARRFIQIHRSF